jgi:hypothetical protein
VEEIASRKKGVERRVKDRMRRRSRCRRGGKQLGKRTQTETQLGRTILSLVVLDQFGLIYYNVASCYIHITEANVVHIVVW